VLAWLAARVETIGIGTSVLLLSMRHPFRVAREAATLQVLSGGRFHLGVGVGWNEVKFRLAGYGFLDRGERADEAPQLVRALWSGQWSRGKGRAEPPSAQLMGAQQLESRAPYVGRTQSVPKRSGTIRLVVARRDTNGQVRKYTNCLTSLLASTDNASLRRGSN
jgi:alkanesulfonate monooxygenase SsuD/methylene tetrahydromethanopterin reductase-like flavin-dependent oxidoreductase (luciferase family)